MMAMARLVIEVSKEVAVAFQLSEEWRREFAIDLFSDAVLHTHKEDFEFDEDDDLDCDPDPFFLDPPDQDRGKELGG